MPIRALTVGVSGLLPANEAGEQMDLFDFLASSDAAKPSRAKREKQEKLEAAVDSIRRRFGSTMITLGNQQNEEIGVERLRRREEGPLPAESFEAPQHRKDGFGGDGRKKNRQ